MKQMKFVPADRLYRLAGWLLPILTFIIFSCKKNNADMPRQITDLNAVAKTLDGEVYRGTIETYQEDDGIVFGFNNWKTIFVLEKLNPDLLPICGNLENAEIIYSNACIVVQNAATKEAWTYVNNNRSSQQKFEEIKSFFANNPSQSLVSGNTRITTNWK
jgi:hypothetical protein